MPRWVKVFLVVAAIAVLAFVITRIAGVDHGPGMHAPQDDHGPQAQRGP